MKITNISKLPYAVVGQAIDKYINDGYGDTHYAGKIDAFKFIYKNKTYKTTVRYLKRYVEFIIDYEEED